MSADGRRVIGHVTIGDRLVQLLQPDTLLIRMNSDQLKIEAE